MKTLSNADAKQLERIYLHLNKVVDKKNDKTNNCVRLLSLIIKKIK